MRLVRGRGVAELNKQAIDAVKRDGSWRNDGKPTNNTLDQTHVHKYLTAVKLRVGDESVWPIMHKEILATIVPIVDRDGFVDIQTLRKVVAESERMAVKHVEENVGTKRCAIYGCNGRTGQLVETQYGAVWMCADCRSRGK